MKTPKLYSAKEINAWKAEADPVIANYNEGTKRPSGGLSSVSIAPRDTNAPTRGIR